MSIDEIIRINNKFKKNSKINRDDVLQSLKHLEQLGTGIQIINNDYISTQTFRMTSEDNALLDVF